MQAYKLHMNLALTLCALERSFYFPAINVHNKSENEYHDMILICCMCTTTESTSKTLVPKHVQPSQGESRVKEVLLILTSSVLTRLAGLRFIQNFSFFGGNRMVPYACLRECRVQVILPAVSHPCVDIISMSMTDNALHSTPKYITENCESFLLVEKS